MSNTTVRFNFPKVAGRVNWTDYFVAFPICRTVPSWTKLLTLFGIGNKMKKKVHSESEKVKAVHQLESGVDAAVVARDYNISRATLYNWKSKYSGMEISQVKRLKELEDENRTLKQMYADLALDNKILKEVIEKKL